MLQSKQDIISSINQIARKYPLRSVALFGSIHTPDFSENSDVDIVVRFDEDLDPLVRGESMMNFQIELEDALHRKVDVINQSYVFNPIMQAVVQEAVLIYGR